MCLEDIRIKIELGRIATGPERYGRKKCLPELRNKRTKIKRIKFVVGNREIEIKSK